MLHNQGFACVFRSSFCNSLHAKVAHIVVRHSDVPHRIKCVLCELSRLSTIPRSRAEKCNESWESAKIIPVSTYLKLTTLTVSSVKLLANVNAAVSKAMYTVAQPETEKWLYIFSSKTLTKYNQLDDNKLNL